MDKFTRERSEGNYMMVCTDALKDQSLSLKARGLLMTIMSLPSNWDFTIKGITKVLKEGTSAIYTAIDELIASGYCIRDVLKNDSNRIAGNEYKFADYPKFLNTSDCEPHQGFPHMENPNAENQAQLNNNKSYKRVNNIEYDCEKLLDDTFHCVEVIRLWRELMDYPEWKKKTTHAKFLRAQKLLKVASNDRGKAIASITLTLEKGWLDFYEPKDYKGTMTSTPNYAPTPSSTPLWKQVGYPSEEAYLNAINNQRR